MSVVKTLQHSASQQSVNPENYRGDELKPEKNEKEQDKKSVLLKR